MDIGSVLILVGVAVLAVAFVARPLVEKQTPADRPQDRRLSGIQAELDRVMAMIQELDMDFAMDKIDSSEHQAQRSTLMTHGAALMRQRDELQGGGSVRPDAGSLDAIIETEVARMRGLSEGPSVFCGNCGQPAMAGDRFCVRCGAVLAAQEMHA
ncbi:MAG: hypothetical protein A2Y93_02550 [Chloroflexi bacterium RBG_13_68_17]|nr:MAG: hypothetical protein A2Y93_02550 [Chloroflexi bacterium RBG_13_68_17]